ncbi:hypothetical protein BJX63DRAFT_41326 [Aspergillus granulosus]|uniref:Zn(2)-C6 fungal-type domain-containing protein n=1 Tax=Aspergillus granulosus TaxID=176169 RepID=A0ABR4GYI2_9EURO
MSREVSPATSVSSQNPSDEPPARQGAAPERTQPRPVQRRAAQACMQCRMRKVRCDVVLRTPPCTNCSLDGVECRIAGTLRRRPLPRQEKRPALVSPPQSSRSSQSRIAPLGANQASTPDAPTTSTRQQYQDFHQRVDGTVPRFPKADREGYLQTVLSANHGESYVSSDPGRRVVDSEQYRVPVDYPQPRDLNPQRNTYLPDFVRPFSVPRPEDVEFLRQRGVFVLLPSELQLMVVDRFEQFTYPVFPTLDISEFRGAICGGNPTYKIPLILYHAVMFVGLGLIESDIIQRFLFTSKEAAREAFYEKTKALYDLNVEHDRMVLCQTSILLVDRIDLTDPKNLIFWIGNAITHAHDLKLYREEPNPPPPPYRNQRKLLWWEILIKECILCMGLPQPPRVWSFGTPFVTMSDFGFDDVQLSRNNSETQALQTPEATLALIFILKVKLFNQIYHILRNIHEDIGGFSGQPIGGLIPTVRQSMARQLHLWHDEVPSGLWIKNLVKTPIVSIQPSVAWAMAINEIQYWTSLMLIFKDDILVELSPHTKPGFMAEHGTRADYSRSLLQHAAGELICVLDNTILCNLSQFLPPSVLHPLILAAAICFQDATSPDPTLRQKSLCKIDVCLQVARQLVQKGPTLAGPVAKMEEAARLLRERAPLDQSNTLGDPEVGRPSFASTPASGLTPPLDPGGDDTSLVFDRPLFEAMFTDFAM